MTWWKKKPVTYAIIVGMAVLSALSFELFIFQNSFAPAGINGLATMIQQIFGFSVGYFSLIINIPLCIVVFLCGDRKFAVRTIVFTFVFSFFLIVFGDGWIDVSSFVYHTDNGTSTILAPIAAGVINGFIYGIVMKRNGSSGGTDVIALILRYRHPEWNMVWLIFILNSVVAVLSYFVYGFQFEPVIMCLIYCLVSSRMCDRILQGMKSQLKFEIVTDQAEEMSRMIISELHHSVTLTHAKGMYSGQDKDLLLCVIQKHQIVKLQRIIQKFPHSFAYLSTVNETYGNFKNIPPVAEEPPKLFSKKREEP